MEDAWWMSNGHEVEVWTLGLDIQCCSTDQDSLVYIVVDKVGAPYRVLLYQPGIRFIHSSNSKGLCLQHICSLFRIRIFIKQCFLDGKLTKNLSILADISSIA